MKLIFATANKHKVEEVQTLLGNAFTIVTPADLGFSDDIPETGNTLEFNSSQKAHFIWEKFGLPCFSDDTGIEVDALNGAPGAFSARYAGIGRDFKENLRLVLKNMEGKTNRSARFRCVISLIIDGEERQFEGRAEGSILTEEHGAQGFGYDPIFLPTGFDRSFAELTLEEKNSISHRGKAVAKLVDYLLQYEQRHQ